jgi:hypothetical protein
MDVADDFNASFMAIADVTHINKRTASVFDDKLKSIPSHHSVMSDFSSGIGSKVKNRHNIPFVNQLSVFVLESGAHFKDGILRSVNVMTVSISIIIRAQAFPFPIVIKNALPFVGDEAFIFIIPNSESESVVAHFVLPFWLT